MVRMMFFSSDVIFPRELPVKLGFVVFDNYSEHVTQIFSCFACLLMLTYFLNTENGHFCVFSSQKISCRQSRFMAFPIFFILLYSNNRPVL